MLKTIIFRLEGVILNDEYLNYKYYEKLWYYLRRDLKWQKFDTVLKLRERLLSGGRVKNPFEIIADRHLDKRDRERYFQEIEIFTNKYLPFYLRIVPGMLKTVQNLKYYYTTILFASREKFLQRVLHKFWLQRYFNMVLPEEFKGAKFSISEFFQNILSKAKSEGNEAVLISDRLSTDIAAANHIGMYTIQARFDPKTKGIMAQNILERKYFESLRNVPELPQDPLQPKQIPQAVAHKPEHLLKRIQNLEAGNLPSEEEQKVSPAMKIDFWELVKQILNPNFEENT